MSNIEYIEKEIFIKNSDKIFVRIDNKITIEKQDIIISKFEEIYDEIIESKIDIKLFQINSFDYIVIMLVIIHCTNLFDKKNFNVKEITSTYVDLIKKDIIQQLSSVILHGSMKHQVLDLINECDNIILINYKKKREMKLKQEKPKNLDKLLDIYNENLKQYEEHKDEKYKNEADKVLSLIYSLTSAKKEDIKLKKVYHISEQDTILYFSKLERKEKNVDYYLDLYNDNMTLYKMFGNPTYKANATRALNKIKKGNFK